MRSRWTFWKTLITGSLLAVYLMGAVHLEGLHFLFHQADESVQHSDAEEKDPCHRSIYHNTQETCGHKAHITKGTHCNVCHLAYHADEWNILTADTSPTFVPVESDTGYSLLNNFLHFAPESSRAPPFM